MEREKPTREGRILKSIVYTEMVGGAGVILFSGNAVAGFALIGLGSLQYAIIKRAERINKKTA